MRLCRYEGVGGWQYLRVWLRGMALAGDLRAGTPFSRGDVLVAVPDPMAPVGPGLELFLLSP